MNVIVALTNALLADSGVSAMTGPRVYPFELPSATDLVMPIKSIVVRPHGGPTSPRLLQINDTRVQLQCYGETPDLAHRLYVASYLALKNLLSYKSAGTYLFWVNPTSGPIPFRDGLLQWPYNVSMWTVRASDLTVT